MYGLLHFRYVEEFIEEENEWVFQRREPCYCHIGKAHWYRKPLGQEPQDKEKVDECSNTGLLDKAKDSDSNQGIAS